MKYEIYKFEGNRKVKDCTQSFEQPELFKLIAKNPDYVIYEDGKDVTKKYRKMK